MVSMPRDVLERLGTLGGGVPPPSDPPPPPLPLSEADRLKVFFRAFGARRFKLKKISPLLAGTQGGGGGPANPPSPPLNPPPPFSSNTFLSMLVHPLVYLQL